MYPTHTVPQADVIDAGLRKYMLSVYNWMTVGLLTTAVVSYGIAHSALINMFYTLSQTNHGVERSPTILAWVVMFAPLAVVWVMGGNPQRFSKGTVQFMYLLLAALLGAGLPAIFLVYTSASIASTFFVTAGMFAAMSIWGYTTGRDLTSMGGFLLMGLIGIILATLVNIFIGSAAISFAISVIGVLVFVGLIAYDTQKIKNDYLGFSGSLGADATSSMAVYSSVSLLLDFLNLFLFMLRFMGVRSNND